MTDLEVSFDVTSGFDALEALDKLPTIFNGDKTVIYGIFRSKAASNQPLEASVSGIAMLKGKVIGVSFEHIIPFKISAPSDSPDSDSFQMLIVHHLAAKSLIRVWEHKEGWASTAPESECKKEIIRVSIESSVISAHTAYIAVDKDQDKPIEGAIQTWDLTAGGLLFGEPPQLQQQSGTNFCDYHSTLGGGGLGGLFGWPPAMSFFASPSPSGGELSGLFQRFSEPSFAPKNTSSYRNPSPPAFGAGPPPADNLADLFSFDHSAQHFQQAAPLKSRSVMEKGLGATRLQSPSNDLTRLISLQQAEGFWNLDKVSRFMKKTLSSPISGVDPTVWATVVALVLLESRFSKQQDEWELVAMKAETWLSMQSLPAGFDVQKLKKEAKKLV